MRLISSYGYVEMFMYQDEMIFATVERKMDVGLARTSQSHFKPYTCVANALFHLMRALGIILYIRLFLACTM